MSAPNHSLANAVMDRIGNQLANLKARWADEKEYEDFADYVALIKSKVNEVEGVEFLSMKKTFAVQWRGSDGFKRETSIKRGYLQTMRIAG